MLNVSDTSPLPLRLLATLALPNKAFIEPVQSLKLLPNVVSLVNQTTFTENGFSG